MSSPTYWQYYFYTSNIWMFHHWNRLCNYLDWVWTTVTEGIYFSVLWFLDPILPFQWTPTAFRKKKRQIRTDVRAFVWRLPDELPKLWQLWLPQWYKLKRRHFIDLKDIELSVWAWDWHRLSMLRVLVDPSYHVRISPGTHLHLVYRLYASFLLWKQDATDLLINKLLVFGVYRAHYVKKYLYTINHKRIALNYLYFTFVSGLAGALLATFIRIELSQPGSHFFKGDSVRYIQVITSHGLVMIFYVVIPIVFGTFANFFVPYHVGSKDVAYPRLNSIGFWILPAGFLLFSKPAFVRRQTYKSWDPYDGYFSTKYDAWDSISSLVDDFKQLNAMQWSISHDKFFNRDRGFARDMYRHNRIMVEGRSAVELALGDKFLPYAETSRDVTEVLVPAAEGGVGAMWRGIIADTKIYKFILKNFVKFDNIWDTDEVFRLQKTTVVPARVAILSLKRVVHGLCRTIGSESVRAFASEDRWQVAAEDITVPLKLKPGALLTNVQQELLSNYPAARAAWRASFLEVLDTVWCCVHMSMLMPQKLTYFEERTARDVKKLTGFTQSRLELHNLLKNFWVHKTLRWDKIDLYVHCLNNTHWFHINNYNVHHTFDKAIDHWAWVRPHDTWIYFFRQLYDPRTSDKYQHHLLNWHIADMAKLALIKGQVPINTNVATWADVRKHTTDLPLRNSGRKGGPFFTLKNWSDLILNWELSSAWSNNPWSTLKNTNVTKSIIIKNHKCNSPAYVMSGWTFITPFSSQTRFTGVGSQDVATVTVVFAGISSTLSFTNLLLTRRVLGTVGVRNRKNTLPFLSITLLLVMRMLAAITPVLGGAMVMLMFDRHALTSFFDYAYGGDIVLFHHLFWFFGHPEVYVVMIPVFGIVNMILPYYNTRRIASKNHLVWATYVMAYMGFLVWGHHMYLVGLDHRSRSLYSTITVMISLPAVVKIVNWTLTLLNGSLCVDVPFVFIMSFLGFFLCGGLTGLWLSHVGLNLFVHDTFYVVAHFHFMFSCATFSGIFSAIYFYFTVFFNNSYARLLASFHYVCWTAGQWITFIPLYWVGYNGLPRRYHDYPKMYSGWHGLATVGHLITMLGIICFFYTVGESKIMKLLNTVQFFSHPRLFKSSTFFLAKQEWLEVRSRNRIA